MLKVVIDYGTLNVKCDLFNVDGVKKMAHVHSL